MRQRRPVRVAGWQRRPDAPALRQPEPHGGGARRRARRLRKWFRYDRYFLYDGNRRLGKSGDLLDPATVQTLQFLTQDGPRTLRGVCSGIGCHGVLQG